MDKVTRTQANKALRDGVFVYAVPSKCSPTSNKAQRLDEGTFINTEWVNVFKHYNCSTDTGTTVSFYI